MGVNCNFCHIEGDFSKDGKEEKESAREMITMTFGINKNSFGGRTEISCNTCHQGHTHPQSAINFDAPAPEPRPKQPDAKPTIDAILAKYETAVGGKEAIAKITSRQIKASRVEPDGKTSEAEEILQKGGKISIATTYPKAVPSPKFSTARMPQKARAQIRLICVRTKPNKSNAKRRFLRSRI